MATALILASAALSSCVAYKLKNDGIARATFGEAIYVDGPTITPLKLLEDSRCPTDVQCIWAGRVKIEARVDLGSGSEIRTVTMGEPARVADGTLELVEVSPDAKADRTIFPEDYRFGFIFKGGI